MGQHRLGDLVADAHDRVQRRHRLLKDHADAGAANVAHLRLRDLEQFVVAKANAAVNARLRWEKSQDRQRGNRLS